MNPVQSDSETISPCGLVDEKVAWKWAIIIVLFIFVFQGLMFFFDLNHWQDPYSAGDAAIYNQFYYNFIKGNFFHNSIFIEDFSQFINPEFTLNMLVWHGYFLSPFIISPLYLLFSNINVLYIAHIVFNVLGIALVSIVFLKNFSPRSVKQKALIAFAIVIGSAWFKNWVALGVPSTLASPLILAACYFGLKGQLKRFATTSILLCLLQDDLSFFIITLSFSLAWFNPKRWRGFASVALVGFCYAVIWNLGIQPWVRDGLISVSPGGDSMLGARLFHIKSAIFEGGGLSWGRCIDFVDGLPRTFFPLVVFLLGILWVGDPSKDMGLVGLGRTLVLVALAPLPHWIYGVWTSSERHVVPVLACGYAAFLWRLGTTADCGWSLSGHRSSRRAFLFGLALLGSFVLPSTRRSVERILSGVSLGAPSEVTAFIKTVNGLSKEKSVTIWCDSAAVGAVSCRQDLWLFPLRAESVDYVIIQKGAKATWRGPLPSTLWSSPPPGTNGLAFQGNHPMNDGDISKVKQWLVGPPGLFDVEREAKNLLVLRRRSQRTNPLTSLNKGKLSTQRKNLL